MRQFCTPLIDNRFFLLEFDESFFDFGRENSILEGILDTRYYGEWRTGRTAQIEIVLFDFDKVFV
jgi:hypothetical protein